MPGIDLPTSIPIQCEPDEWLCLDRQRCVSRAARCDRRQDCIDNSDELHCEHQCQGNQFRCNNGRCVHEDWVCDTFDDCGDNSDEIGCIGKSEKIVPLKVPKIANLYFVLRWTGQETKSKGKSTLVNETLPTKWSTSFEPSSTPVMILSTSPATVNLESANEITTTARQRLPVENGKSKGKATTKKSGSNRPKTSPRMKSLAAAQVTTGDGLILNAPYLRVFPLVPQNESTSVGVGSSTRNLTAPRNRGEEDEEFDKRRNNDLLNKTRPLFVVAERSRPDPSSDTNIDSRANILTTETSSSQFVARKAVLVSSTDRTVTSTKSAGTITGSGPKIRKKSKSNLGHNRLATGKATLNPSIGCAQDRNSTGSCFYGLFRCVSGKCTITSFDCGGAAGKGRRVSVVQTDFAQFL